MRRNLAAAAVLALSIAATASASPKGLYQNLLTSPFPDSALPSGFSSAKIGVSALDATDRKFHVVGAVQVEINGPDVGYAIVYGVHDNPRNALAGFRNGSRKCGTHVDGCTIVGKIPGYKIPSVIATGSLHGKNAFGKDVTNGVTIMAVSAGSVNVQAISLSADNEASGDFVAARKLLAAGLAHLRLVESRTKR